MSVRRVPFSVIYAGCRPGALGPTLSCCDQRHTRRMEECEPCAALDLETEWRELDALPVVDTVRHDVVKESAHQRRTTDRVICTLWCSSCHPAGDLRQPAVKTNLSTVPTLAHRAGIASQDRRKARRLPESGRGRTSCCRWTEHPVSAGCNCCSHGGQQSTGCCRSSRSRREGGRGSPR